MTIDDQEQVTGFGKMFESCLAISVLIKVEKVTSFIELHIQLAGELLVNVNSTVCERVNYSDVRFTLISQSRT